jgi:hypothetical protein
VVVTTPCHAATREVQIACAPALMLWNAITAAAIAAGTFNGGQFFICDTKKNCDAIYAYYHALKALAGPTPNTMVNT